MNIRSLTVALGITFLATTASYSHAGYHDEPASPDGVEVQTRGPVHEAYAEPVTSQPQATPVVAKQPPDPIDEVPAEQKPEGQDVQWIPGYWAFDEDRDDFLWVSGFWRVPPPDRRWLPGHWNQVEGGWQWVPGLWALNNQQETAYLPPPPETVDAGPQVPAPDNDSVYVPGNWVYRDTRYVWRPGFWNVYRPGWVWVPAHYVWTPGGYLFVEGYWDYPLRDRGLLFAPALIDYRARTRPSWFYRPSFVVYDDCLFGALFVRPSYGHYYFGDYFDARYRGLGFTAWVDFRIGRSGYDPLFSYYRWNFRSDRHWEGGLRDLYTARFQGNAARPPRTLIQQNTLLQNITVNKTVNVTNIKHVTMVAPLTKVDRTMVKLQPVAQSQLNVERKSVQEFREMSKQRGRLETQVRVKTSEAPRPVTMTLPHPATTVRVSTTVNTPPPLPIKVETKVPVGAPRKDVILTPEVHHPESKLPPAPLHHDAKPQPAPVHHPEPKPSPHHEVKPQQSSAHPMVKTEVHSSVRTEVKTEKTKHAHP